MPNPVTVFFHNNCNDGVCSCVLFSRFYRAVKDPQATFTYRGLAFGAVPPDDELFTGTEHAILDFPYNPKTQWWIDHHAKGVFASPEDQADFESDRSGQKFYDPSLKSCTKLIALIAEERFGVTFPDLNELIHWANVIDGATFTSVEEAVSLDHPAQKLAFFIQTGKVSDFLPELISLLLENPLDQVLAHPRVQGRLQPLLDEHNHAFEVIRKKAKYEKGVVYFDVREEGIFGFSKFFAYKLFPDAMYSVDLSTNPGRTKITIGYNPWCGKERTANIGDICKRHGGGGHPPVGAFPTPDQSTAHELMMSVVTELQDSQTQMSTH